MRWPRRSRARLDRPPFRLEWLSLAWARTYSGALMSLSDLASLGSFVSGVAVLASLVFLFFQMRQMTEQVRQGEKNQRAMVQVERAARGANQLRFLADPAIVEAFTKGRDGKSDITLSQYWQFFFAVRAALVSWEDAYFQHQQGLLDEAAFEATLATLREYFSGPGFRAVWRRNRFLHDRSFRDFVDDVLGKVDVVNPRSGEEELASWHRDVAAELSKARA